MQYLGGKFRIAKQLAEAFAWPASGVYVEPFVGAGHVLHAVARRYPDRRASDSNAALIAMWQALQDGWVPPSHVSEEEYAAARLLPDEDPLKAFVGFGCSFSGKWFGGYARNAKKHNYTLAAKNSFTKLDLSGITFTSTGYGDMNYPPGSVVYCDPPYIGMTGYGGVGKFDWDKFWSHFEDVSRRAHVYVSEYTAPSNWECVLEIPTRLSLRTKANGCEARTERLWRIK